MASMLGLIKQLQTAINTKGENLMYNTTQFYSNNQHRTITLYCIKKCVVEEGIKNRYIKLIESPSKLQIILFLKDYWDLINGRPLDMSNSIWNEKRKKLPFYTNNDLVEEDYSYDDRE